MTNEEAIKILNTYDVNFHNEEGHKIRADKICEACDMGVKALEQTQWIPVKYHEATKEEIEENGYPFDICYIFDNVMPCDEQEILVTVKGRSGKSYVEKDTCYADDGYYLDSGYDWLTDVVAWRELPEPYKAESEGE